MAHDRDYLIGVLVVAIAGLSFCSLYSFLATWFSKDPEDTLLSRNVGEIPIIFSIRLRSARFAKMLLYFSIFVFSLTLYFLMLCSS